MITQGIYNKIQLESYTPCDGAVPFYFFFRWTAVLQEIIKSDVNMP